MQVNMFKHEIHVFFMRIQLRFSLNFVLITNICTVNQIFLLNINKEDCFEVKMS